MNTIEWRKWNLNDFELFYFGNKKVFIEDIPTNLPVNLCDFKRLLNILVTQSKHKPLYEMDPFMLSGFHKQELLNLTTEDIIRGDNFILKEMLSQFEKNELKIPAPLVEFSNGVYCLIDGNHRSVFAKIVKIPIKVQVVESSFYQLAKKLWSHYKLS